MAKLIYTSKTPIGKVFSEKVGPLATTKKDVPKPALKITSHVDGQEVSGVVQIMVPENQVKLLKSTYMPSRKLVQKRKKVCGAFSKMSLCRPEVLMR